MAASAYKRKKAKRIKGIGRTDRHGRRVILREE